MKVLVIGASGFLGRAVMKEFQTSEHQVFATACSRASDVAGLLHLDIVNPSDVSLLFDEIKPDVAILCSAVSGNRQCNADPGKAAKVNINGLVNVAAECKRLGALLVWPSTVALFDGERSPFDGGYREVDEPGPVAGNLYAETKLVGERCVRLVSSRHIITRVATGYGPIYPGDESNFVGLAARWLATAESSFKFMTDQWDTPVFIGDVAKAFRLLIEQGFEGLINVAGPEKITKHDFAVAIKKALGLPGQIGAKSHQGIDEFTNKPFSYPANMMLETAKLTELGIKLSGVKEGLQFCR